MHNTFREEVTHLENVVFVCFGKAGEDDLPQIADEDGVVVDLLQEYSGKPHEFVKLELHHQLDPSAGY